VPRRFGISAAFAWQIRDRLSPLVVLTGAIVLLSFAVGAWGFPWPKYPQEPHPAVVRVTARDRAGYSLGSGTLVAADDRRGLVLTNWHVVRNPVGPIQISFPNGFRSPALVVATDRTWDLALLAISSPGVAPVPLARRPPRPGEWLVIAGYGSGVYRAARGRCTQYVAPGLGQPYEMIEVGTYARQGDSGGPIFNERGELAGVLFGSGWGRTVGSHCQRIRLFLAATDQRWPAGLPGEFDPTEGMMVRQLLRNLLNGSNAGGFSIAERSAPNGSSPPSGLEGLKVSEVASAGLGSTYETPWQAGQAEQVAAYQLAVGGSGSRQETTDSEKSAKMIVAGSIDPGRQLEPGRQNTSIPCLVTGRPPNAETDGQKLPSSNGQDSGVTSRGTMADFSRCPLAMGGCPAPAGAAAPPASPYLPPAAFPRTEEPASHGAAKTTSALPEKSGDVRQEESIAAKSIAGNAPPAAEATLAEGSSAEPSAPTLEQLARQLGLELFGIFSLTAAGSLPLLFRRAA